MSRTTSSSTSAPSGVTASDHTEPERDPGDLAEAGRARCFRVCERRHSRRSPPSAGAIQGAAP